MKSNNFLVRIFSIQTASIPLILACLAGFGLAGFELGGILPSAYSADGNATATDVTTDVTSEFSEVNQRLFFDNHLSNTTVPSSLRYAFSKKSNFENDAPFTDTVVINLTSATGAAGERRNATVEYFTGERKRFAPEFNNAIGNPILTIALQRDIYQMERLLNNGTSWRHFQKRLKVAFEETAHIEPTEFTLAGNSVQGETITVLPFVDDPLSKRFPAFREKIYIFTLSNQVPGNVYQITTVVDDAETGSSIEESFTFSGG